MINLLLIFFGKTLSLWFRLSNLGNGSTWPGHIALKVNPNFTKDLLHNSSTKVVFIVGTNGKTTTTSLLTHVLKSAGKTVVQNTSGANLQNGIASALLANTSLTGKLTVDVALLEIDENAFVQIARQLQPDAIIFLNLFRDQLDRYGEVNTIAKKWQQTIATLPAWTQLFLNADDPQISYLGENAKHKVNFFGIEDKGTHTLDHASDSTYCPICGNKLIYQKVYFSHLGIWSCPTHDFQHPEEVFTTSFTTSLSGLYNQYNITAAVLLAKSFGLTEEQIIQGLKTFTPAFGRQEVLTINDKKVEVVLTKNPAGFNQALSTIIKQNCSHLLLVLNDRIADGTDVSWIWDVDFEKLHLLKRLSITVTGDRVYDLALRLKYADLLTRSEENVENAIKQALLQTDNGDILYILPTYTAMLEVRKILTGKKIL